MFYSLLWSLGHTNLELLGSIDLFDWLVDWFGLVRDDLKLLNDVGEIPKS